MFTKIGCAGHFKNCNPIDKIEFFKLRPLRVSIVYPHNYEAFQ